MKDVYISPKIEVRDSDIHGRGIFAKDTISAGEVLERCHFLKLDLKWDQLDTPLQEYAFAYPAGGPGLCVVFGWGSIYNHSNKNNAQWEIDEENRLFVFKSIKNINAGEEIFTNYGYRYSVHFAK